MLRKIAFVTVLTSAIQSVAFSTSALAESDWHGPGWYAMAGWGDGEDNFIVKGPFTAESDCKSYVTGFEQRTGGGAWCEYLSQDLPPD